MNSMNEDFKPGDIVFNIITNTGWNYRNRGHHVTKTVHEGVVVWVKAKTCGVQFKSGMKPKPCNKINLKLRRDP